VSQSGTSGLPAWVKKRGGRLEPFDADKIVRGLFAATEACGRPDAFLARELTDGVLLFLMRDLAGQTPASAQIAELVTKVVRELGHPVVARAFAEFAVARGRAARKASARYGDPLTGDSAGSVLGPTADQIASWLDKNATEAGVIDQAGRRALEQFSLSRVFSRDVVAAAQEGFVLLGGLASPRRLQAVVLPGPLRAGILESIEEARQLAGDLIVWDSPEFLTGSRESSAATAHDFDWAIRLTALSAVVNLNIAEAPQWAGAIAGGPLFAESISQASQPSEAARSMAECFLTATSSVRIDWHLGERDFAETGPAWIPVDSHLGTRVSYVLDRPARQVVLAEGLDRTHGACLLEVGIQLPRLAAEPAVRRDPNLFLRKLQSLTRLALSAAARKREYLRRHGRLGGGMLVDRARVVIVPIGLEAIVHTLTDRMIDEMGPPLARDVLEAIVDACETDGRRQGLDSCVDSSLALMTQWLDAEGDDRNDFPVAPPERRGEPGGPAHPPGERRGEGRGLPLPLGESWGEGSNRHRLPGLTTWRPDLTPQDQIRKGGWLHQQCGGGTLYVTRPENDNLTMDGIVTWLKIAWHETSLTRIILARSRPSQVQLVAPWEKEALTRGQNVR
jgi:hypothetical protein